MPLKKEKFSGRQNIFESVSVEIPDQRKLQTQALKRRDIPLLTKFHLVKAVVFPVVMYGCESWTIKKAEQRKTDAFELWCWRRFFC